jgi:hypothetical protein
METWLSTLKAASPQEGFELAVKLSHMAVNLQPSDDARAVGREDYEGDSAR